MKNNSEWMHLNCRKSFSKNLFGVNFLHPYYSDKLYSGHSFAKGTFDETKMFTRCVKVCSNQSRSNKNLSYHKIPDQEKKKTRDAWISQISPKTVHVCSDHFTKYSFDESQELKRRLLGSNFKYILKPDAFLSLFPYDKVINKLGSGSVRLLICSQLSGNKKVYDSVYF